MFLSFTMITPARLVCSLILLIISVIPFLCHHRLRLANLSVLASFIVPPFTISRSPQSQHDRSWYHHDQMQAVWRTCTNVGGLAPNGTAPVATEEDGTIRPRRAMY